MTEDLAELYRDWKKDDQAAPLFARALDVRRRQPEGNESPKTASVLVSLGQIRLRQKKGSDAESLLREAAAIYEKKEPESWLRFEARGLLGESLAAQARYAEAEPLVLEGYEGLRQRARQVPYMRRTALAEAGDRVVRLYEAWGKSHQAVVWRVKLSLWP
jgi:hypothetical protein